MTSKRDLQRGFSLLIVLLAVVATMAMLTAAGAKIHEAGVNAERTRWMTAAQVLRTKEVKKANEASDKLEAKREVIRTVYRDITRDVDKIIDRPVYLRVCFDDDGVAAANMALTGKAGK